MSLCDEIAADAAGLAALPRDAPERVRADEHARTCAACAAALAQAQRLLQLLEAAAPLPAPSEAALRRAAAPILSELDQLVAPPARARRRIATVAGAAALGAWALPLALSRHPIVGGRTLAASVALAALAAVSAGTTISAGGFVAAAFPLLSGVFSLVAGESGGLAAALGVHCALTELAAAIGATLFAWLATRRIATAGDRATLTVAAAGGGALAAQAALHEACGAALEMPHLLVFHTGAVVVVMALALLVAHALTTRPASLRSSSRR